MDWTLAIALLFSLIIGMMLIGMPVAIAFLASNLVGAYVFLGGEAGIRQMLTNGFGAMTNFSLVPIPMFLLMGELFYHTGLGQRMFNAIDQLFGNVRGRLAYVTVAGGTGFAALSGSSMGSTALLGSLMVPEMMRRGSEQIPVDRPDPRDRWACRHHSAERAGGAACDARQDRRRRAADCRHRPRTDPGGNVLRIDLCLDHR